MTTKPDKREAQILEWATTTPRRTGGVRCAVCSHEASAAIIRAVVTVRKAGEPTVSQRQLHEKLTEELGPLPYSPFTMGGHIRRCLGGWE